MGTVSTDKATSLVGDERVIKELLEGNNDRPVLRGQTVVPKISEPQIRQASAVILTDYWKRNCWMYRLDGHSTFRCKYLTVVKPL